MSKLNKKWEGKTGGGLFGQAFLFLLLKRVRVSLVYPILFFVIPFYLIFGRKGYKAIFSYFNLNLGFNKFRSFLSTFRNHYIFGEVVLDKFALLAGNSKQFQVEVEGIELFNKLIEEEKGFIIASAHIGNFELVGHCLRQDKKKINGIIYGGETKNYQKQRIEALEKSSINLIEVSDDMSHLFAIKEALDNGEVVSLPCDRVLGSNKTIAKDFLGKKALFPIGTFKLAAQLNVPVIAIFIMKEKKLRYKGYAYLLNSLEEEKSSTKKAEFIAEQYVNTLEKTIKKYPYQWFNYYKFWE